MIDWLLDINVNKIEYLVLLFYNQISHRRELCHKDKTG